MSLATSFPGLQSMSAQVSLSAWLKATIQFPLLFPFSVRAMSSPTVNISKKTNKELLVIIKAWVARYTRWAWSLQV